MAEGFSLIPEEAPPATRSRKRSVYRQLLADALAKFEADPKIGSLRVGTPAEKKFITVYCGLRDRLKDPEFADKLSIRGVGGKIYIERGVRKTAAK
ncbi:MAG: hypothetical protein M1274_09305 [Actinobacteria bacterium]|nr:hypothetical protein [Actinomycetota bacterium]